MLLLFSKGEDCILDFHIQQKCGIGNYIWNLKHVQATNMNKYTWVNPSMSETVLPGQSELFDFGLERKRRWPIVVVDFALKQIWYSNIIKCHLCLTEGSTYIGYKSNDTNWYLYNVLNWFLIMIFWKLFLELKF